jgi:hypothetical protein
MEGMPPCPNLLVEEKETWAVSIDSPGGDSL